MNEPKPVLELVEPELESEPLTVEAPKGRMPLPPIMLSTQQIDYHGRDVVALGILMPGYGQLTFLIEPSAARKVGAQLQQLGSSAEVGLIVASRRLT